MEGYCEFTPAVFAVDEYYQIMIPCKKPCLFFVKVADEYYYDESNGIMRSKTDIHKVRVPAKVLDKAGEYTIYIRPVIRRRPYFTKTGKLLEKSYKFYPVPEKNIRAYHISDAHNLVDEPVRAVKAFGDIDFLILNGDVIEHSGNSSRFMNIYKICSILTSGEKPVVFSRGNHDLRGNYAEKFADYTPEHLGNTYYSFRLGSIWGMVLDCGEDKPDDHPEYGFTVACHSFRKRQTEFLKQIISQSQKQYAAEGVKHKLVICHNPFTNICQPPFDIEQEIYSEWAALIKDNVSPDVMICGHLHELNVYYPDDTDWNGNGSICPVVIGSTVKKGDKKMFAGCGYVFGDDKISLSFTDSDGNVLKELFI